MHVRYIRRSLILSLVVLLLVEVYRIHQLSVSFFVFVMYLLRIYCTVYCSFFVLPAFIVLAVSIMPNVYYVCMFPDPCFFFAVSRRPQIEDWKIRGEMCLIFLFPRRMNESIMILRMHTVTIEMKNYNFSSIHNNGKHIAKPPRLDIDLFNINLR